MRPLNNGIGEAQILFILVAHESSAKGRAEGKDRFHRQGKECPDSPTHNPVTHHNHPSRPFSHFHKAQPGQCMLTYPKS